MTRGSLTIDVRFHGGIQILTWGCCIWVEQELLGITVTMDQKQEVEAMQIVNPEIAIPIHYNDYDVFESPLSDFQGEIAEAGLEHRVHYLSHGQQYNFEVSLTKLIQMSSARVTPQAKA